VLDRLTRALAAAVPRGEFSAIPLYNPRRGADARVFFRSFRPAAAAGVPTTGGVPTAEGEPTTAREPTAAGEPATAREALDAAVAALAALPEVAAVHTRGDALTVHFADEPLAALGARLEAGEARAMDVRDVLAGTEVLVNFCDANPTKALHIGHLRNIALGQALAGALGAAGARVTRQSQVSDYCRSMGEALAGYMEMPTHLAPRTLGVKSDHFVGECFLRYASAHEPPPADGAAALAEAPTGAVATTTLTRAQTAARAQEQSDGAGDPALSAEATVRHDLAEELLERLGAGDPEILERWHKLREWALEGQDATLATLGVTLDRKVPESDSRPLARQILDTGVATGVLTRTDTGAVVYETGEDEYPRLLLARADGFPTQHLRTFALWHSLRTTLDGTRSIELVGEEWHAYVRYHERLMRGVAPSAESRHPTCNVIYGMVTVEGGAVKSSNGRPPLVDGLLERLCASDELEALAARSEGRFDARRLAAVVAMGFYLGRPTRKPVDLTLTEMLELRGGVGWDLARAAVHAWRTQYDGPPDPAPEEGRYRQTVLRSQVHRQLVERAVEQLDTYELARFYGHLSRRYLATDGGARTANGTHAADGEARVARAMRTLLAAGLGALGLPGAVPEGGGAG
jgi:arginyl-tRNA synthetase